MRIALLSALAESPEFKGERLAFRRFVGKSVLAHQVEQALKLECGTIICHSSGLSQEIIACQNLAEASGSRFVLIDSSRRLASLVTASNEIIALADGLLSDPDTIAQNLSRHPRILTFPAEPAISKGFERIDQTRAWAGAMRIQGALVERLSDLPPDSDPVSALLRIALQAGVTTQQLDPQILVDGQWSLHENLSSRQAREKSWLSRFVSPVPYTAPGTAVAERVGMRLAQDIMGGALERLPWFVATGAGILAALSAIFGHAILGLSFALAMVFAIPIGSVFERLAAGASAFKRKIRFTPAFAASSDLLIAALLAMSVPDRHGWLRLFVPLILLGILRLGEKRAPIQYRATFADRIVLLAVLLPAAVFDLTLEVTAALAAAGLCAIYLLEPDSGDDDRSPPRRKLTFD